MNTTQIQKSLLTNCFDTKNQSHSYDVETNEGFIYVNAANRTQARRIMEKKGYKVYSVNFAG